ncbi:MAG: cyclopropane-fatty-acyl-phospholipid synthase family protein [Verrucomicrobiota bacterium]
MTRIAALTPAVTRAMDFLEDAIGAPALERVAFELWDGARWPDDTPRPATIVLKHPEALERMFGGGTEKSLAEAYLRDDFDVRGELEAAFELADFVARLPHPDWLTMFSRHFQLLGIGGAPLRRSWRRLVREVGEPVHSPGRDRQAVSFHYDMSNDFFALWLDPRMQYSCAYYEKNDTGLDAAQTAKLHHLCRKLRLKPRQRVLDVGCGWGGFALFAVQHYGAQVTGVTLSPQQAALASNRARAAGLATDVTIELRDYRDLPEAEPFDAIVSVGMSEHVGRAHLEGYFEKLGRLLKPGGVFLNHAIGEGVRPRGERGPSFIDEHVFPDSDIPPIPVVLTAAERAGFEVRDVENLRDHYTRTLRQWVGRLEDNHERALRYVDEATYRVWRLYLAGSAHGFRTGQLGVYQALLAKPGASGDVPLPLTRRDWYH